MEVNNEINKERIGGIDEITTTRKVNDINFLIKLMVKIYKNFKFIICIFVVITASILVLLAMVEFGKDDSKERSVKSWFFTILSLSLIIMLSLGINFVYIKDKSSNMDWSKDVGLKKSK